MEFSEELKLFKEQLKFKEKIELPKNFDNIVMAGMGGSGIAGQIFNEFYSEKPLYLVDDYELPKFINNKTLFIGTSFSGTTEEVLSSTSKAKKAGAYTVTISSGGPLAESGDQHIRIPRNDIQPRSATGYMLMPVLLGFNKITEEEIDNSYKILSNLDSNNDEAKSHAKNIAQGDKIPVIYGSAPFKVTAYRWKTQFNENAKVLAYTSNFPELNHNDTMALAQTYRKKDFYLLVFASAREKIAKRITITAKITDSDFHLVTPKGASDIEKMFYLYHYGDYLTYNLALLRGVDPTDVTLIQNLKKML